jgi:hypothetical protein
MKTLTRCLGHRWQQDGSSPKPAAAHLFFQLLMNSLSAWIV